MRNSVVVILLFLFSCGQPSPPLPAFESNAISGVITEMTEVMIHDITNPPLAARFFSYACLSGYEVIAQNDSSFKSLYKVLNGYPSISRPDSLQGYHVEISALLAMMETAKK